MAVNYRLPSGETLQIRKDLSGQRFGMLTVIEPYGKTGSGTIWKCECDCGNMITRTSSNLLNSPTQLPKNCGCYTQAVKPRNKGTRLHTIWSSMKGRCRNANHPAYYRYGGRGITVCEEWSNSFDTFRDWALKNGYSDELTIDRIDNDKGYSPNNCRWADMKTQCNNTGRNHYITWNGVTHTLTEWSRIIGVSYGTLKSRIFKRGMSDIKALEMGVDGRK